MKHFFLKLSNHFGLITFLIFVVVNSLYLTLFDQSLFFSAFVYLWGLIMSSLFFVFLVSLYRHGNFIMKHVFALLFSFLFVGLIISNGFVFNEFGQCLNASMINFVIKDLHYLLDYFKTYLVSFYGVVFLMGVYGFYWLWRPKERVKGVRYKKRTYFFITVLVLLFILQIDFLRKKAVIYQLPIVASTLVGVAELSINNLSHRTLIYPLFNSKRARLNSHSLNKKLPNVILVLNESWGKNQGLPFYQNPDENAMPKLTNRIQLSPENWAVFNQALTNSTATDVSVPSVLTGVAPYESGAQLHYMPLLWDWAKAAKKNTFLLTSQRFSWGHFDDFFFSSSLDKHFSAEDSKAPIINDLGIDDLIMIEELENVLHSISNESGFVGVINTNCLHAPYQQTSNQLGSQPQYKTNYKNALSILDETLERVFKTLGNKLDDTIIIISSDHGEEPLYTKHAAPRIYSFYEEFFGIPFLIYLPKKWQGEYPDLAKQIKKNTNTTIQNIDIFPTIAHLLSLDKINPNIFQQFQGHSLASVIPDDRYIIGLNTNDNRWWNQEGIGIAQGSYRWIGSNVSGIFYSDLRLDLDQVNNQWDLYKSTSNNHVDRFVNQFRTSSRVWQMAKDVTK